MAHDAYDLAHQAWEILVEVAEQPQRRPITYGELATQLNARTGRGLTALHMSGPLALIMDYCDRHTLPRLNDLVVSKATGWPSYTPAKGYDFRAKRLEIFAHRWRDHTVGPNDFAPLQSGGEGDDTLEPMPDNSMTRFALTIHEAAVRRIKQDQAERARRVQPALAEAQRVLAAPDAATPEVLVAAVYQLTQAIEQLIAPVEIEVKALQARTPTEWPEVDEG